MGRRHRSFQVALAVAAVAVIGACRGSSPIDRAIDIIENDKQFTSGERSGTAIARVAVVLRDDGNRCTKRQGADDARCVARLNASAFAQVLALSLLECTAPDREDARADALRYLRAVKRVGKGDNPPAIPKPRCG